MVATVSTPTPSTTPSWYDDRDAPTRVDLETCIHCGLCLTACPTYRELKIEPDSPRGRIYLMRGLAEGRVSPDDPLVEHLDLCLGCRACETACPAGVPYGRMLEEARGQLNRRVVRGSLTRMLGEWVLRTVFPHRERLHAAAGLLRIGQSGPIASFMNSSFARKVMPRFATQGWQMTPPIPPRKERALERLRLELPAEARLDETPEGLTVYPAGEAKARVAFFRTCVMDVMFSHVSRDTVRLLAIAGAEVRIPNAQTCCGALHAHAGLRDEAKELARRNARAFDDDVDFIVSHSAGCGAAMREAGHLLHGTADEQAATRYAERVRDVSQVLDQLGLPEPRIRLYSERDPASPLRIAYHDPCHLAHGQGVREEPRRLLRNLPGAELVELPNSDWCCGSAGVYNLSHPDMADAQLDRKMDSIRAVDPEVVVASNPGCQLHMARGAAEREVPVTMMHLVELLGRVHPPGA